MIRIKRCSLLMIILALTNCNQGSNAKSGGTGGGKDDPVLTNVGDQDNKGDLKVKLKDLLIKFKLSDAERQIVHKIQEVVTNPDIGKAGGYKTYDDLKFYNLLKDLGALKVKEIIVECLKVDNHQESGKEEFNQAINNVPAPYLKERLQSDLGTYNYKYVLELKKYFSNDNANYVYDAIIKNYVAEATREIDDQLNRFVRIDYGHSGVLKHIENAVAIYLKLDDGESKVIGELRDLVTSPSQDYKTYTVKDFDSLISALGVVRVKEIVRAYNTYAEDYEIMKRDIEKLKDTKYKSEFEKRLESAKESLKLERRKFFTKFGADGIADLAALPDPNYVHAGMVRSVYDSALGNIRMDSYFMLIYERNLEDLIKDLTEDKREVLKEALRDIDTKAEKNTGFSIYPILGGLYTDDFEYVVKFQVRISQAIGAISKVLEESSDFPEKQDLKTEFDDTLKSYYDHLKESFNYGRGDSKFIRHMMDTKDYADSFDAIKKEVLDLSLKNGAGSKPGSSPSTTLK
ncbi:hypothetical protein bcCo53_001252 (plasmid) [Borrelia coriaceae]|nr:hypothetical protein [Borrelia coriaceae]UPA17083.1 hypothetical protein bcCo53_001252 [Borrelia coriaceae]